MFSDSQKNRARRNFPVTENRRRVRRVFRAHVGRRDHFARLARDPMINNDCDVRRNVFLLADDRRGEALLPINARFFPLNFTISLNARISSTVRAVNYEPLFTMISAA